MKLLRKFKYLMIRLFRLKNSSHSISLGIILGFLPCWYPTFGIGPILSVLISRIFKANAVAALVAAAIGSFLWPLLFYFNYWSGALFFGGTKPDPPEFDYEDSVDIYFYEKLKQKFLDFGIPFIWGSVFNSIVFSISGYFLFRYLFSKYRLKILGQLRN